MPAWLACWVKSIHSARSQMDHGSICRAGCQPDSGSPRGQSLWYDCFKI